MVLRKIYKRRVSGKTYDALDEENTSISCIANNEADVTIGSCSSRQSPTIVSARLSQLIQLWGTAMVTFNLRLCLSFTDIFILSESQVSNGSEQMLSDVSSTECVEIEDVDPLKWVEGVLLDEEIGNDPRMFPEELQSP